MSDITLKAIEELLDLKLEEKLDKKLDEKLQPIQETLDNHTKILDRIAKDVDILKNENTITAKRLDNLEDWGQKVGKKVDIALDL